MRSAQAQSAPPRRKSCVRTWGGGSKAMYAFSKFQNNEIISAKSLVLAFLFVRFFFGGGRRVYKRLRFVRS